MHPTILILTALSLLSTTTTASPLRFPNFTLKPILSSLQNALTCDLSAATMPNASSPLPSVTLGLSLYHVAIGRGTQNYTCATSTSASVPVAIGAVATLYNASCIAASYPGYLASLPAIALQQPNSDSSSMLGMTESGHHYFQDTTTPTFDLNALSQFTFAKKLASVPAPTGSDAGVNDQGNGAVAWLKLEHETTGQIGDIQEIYRMNTAGGSPPPTCDGVASSFQVQYSAEYWFWSGSS